MAVPYTFATATSSIPLSQLDANFATGITLGNTTVYLGNTTTSIGNLTLTNATISSVASTFPNSYLANSSVTIGSTNVSLGGTATTIAGLTLTSPTITGGTSTATQNLANVTGTLAVGNGGTGLTSLTAGYIPYGNGTSALGSSANLYFDGTNLGIGTTSPSTKLYVSGTGSLATFGGNSSSNVVPDIQIVRSSSGTGIQTGPNITFSDSTTNNTCTIQNSQGSLTFWNYGSSAWNERMRIDSSGNLLVGTTTSGGVGYTLLYNASGPTWINNWSVDGGTHASFRTAGVQKGYIATSGGVTIYSTTSDERAKENIEPSASALQSILDTEIVSFDFKDKSGHTNYGGIAQRLLNTIPETIFVPKNPDEMMGVDWSKGVPRLIKSIQEQQAIIESLTQRIATLENK